MDDPILTFCPMFEVGMITGTPIREFRSPVVENLFSWPAVGGRAVEPMKPIQMIPCRASLAFRVFFVRPTVAQDRLNEPIPMFSIDFGIGIFCCEEGFVEGRFIMQSARA